MSRRLLVLWDIDGTLVNMSGVSRLTFFRCLDRHFGCCTVESSVRESLSFGGKTDLGIVEEALAGVGLLSRGEGGLDPECAGRLLTQERMGGFYQGMEEELERGVAELPDAVQVCLGVQDLVAELAQRQEGFVNALLTGNSRQTGLLKTRLAGFPEGTFRVGAFGCQSARREDLPPLAAQALLPVLEPGEAVPHSMVVVGDTVRDIACAHAHDLPCVAVATGSTSVQKLERHIREPWDRVFADLSDTAAVLDHLEWLRQNCPTSSLFRREGEKDNGAQQ